MSTGSTLYKAEKNDASRKAALDAVRSEPGYWDFVGIAKFTKRFEVITQRDYFMARDRGTGDTYMSMYGEGIRVTWQNPSQGQPKRMEILDKGHRFSNATEFAYALFTAVLRGGQI